MRYFSGTENIKPVKMTDEIMDKTIKSLRILAGKSDIETDVFYNRPTFGKNVNSEYLHNILAIAIMQTMTGQFYFTEDINYKDSKSICNSVFIPMCEMWFNATSYDTMSYTSDEYTGNVIITDEKHCRVYPTLDDAIRWYNFRYNTNDASQLVKSFEESAQITSKFFELNERAMQRSFRDTLDTEQLLVIHGVDDARTFCINKMVISTDKQDIPICNHCHSLLAFKLDDLIMKPVNIERVPIYCPNCDKRYYANLKLHHETNPNICDVCIMEKPAITFK